jgi:hypothetical protein
MNRVNCLIRYTLVIAMIAPTACTAIAPDGDDPVGSASTDGRVGETTQALTGVHKICSGVDDGNFRDSIEVDDGWSTTTCLGWARSIGGGDWQMGCLFSNGFSWGATNGGIPSPNCGW